MQFSSFDCEAFLRDHWQKTPLLVRNPWREWKEPLDPDDLAGLACEEEVESRLVMQSGDGLSLEHGPFDEDRFAALGGAPWTLLVQGVDQHVPAVAALLRPFRFIPNWRVDDVMVSYASDRAGVGAHFDQYDVFLVQGAGRRRWQLGPVCHADTPLLQHDDLRLLATFEPVAEWVLETGDMLYLPPGVAHEGVALGDGCMTYSIGFRSPSRSELMSHWCDHAIDGLEDDDRYTDPTLALQGNPGEISPAAIAALHGMALERMLDREAFARWFGRYSTSAKTDIDWSLPQPFSSEDLRARLSAGLPLCRNPGSRWSFIRSPSDGVLLFVDGQCHDCAGDAARFAQEICAGDDISLEAGVEPAAELIALLLALCNDGSLAFEEAG